MSDWRADVIRLSGGKPSPQTLAFLNGWGLKEGGHLHNTARFNWLNRIDTDYPSAGLDVGGIAAYPNYQTGVQRTASLIKEGYPAIYNALRQGQVSYGNPNVQGDLNRWLTGNRTPGMTPYISKVAQLSGSKPPPGGWQTAAPPAVAGQPPPAAAPPAQTPPAQAPSFLPNLQNVMGLIGAMSQRRAARDRGEQTSLAPMIGQIMAMRQQQQNPAAPPPPPTTNAAQKTPPGTNPSSGVTVGSGPAPSGGLREMFYDPLGAYDEGNWIAPIGGHSDHVHFSFGTPQAGMEIIAKAQSMGLRTTENPYAEGSQPEAGVHVKGSYHYQMFPGSYEGGKLPTLGRGLDVSGPAEQMAALYKWAKARYIG